MAKGAGRKKKDGKRHPCGKLVHLPDGGAQELIDKKIAATLSRHEDLTAVGVLSGRGIIDRDMKEAALDFERHHRIAFGSSSIAPPNYDRVDHSGESDRWVKMISTSHMMALYIERLNDLGPGTFVMIRDLILHSQSGGLIPLIIAGDVVRYAPPPNSRRYELGQLEARKGRLTDDMRFRIGLVTRALQTLSETRPKRK